MNVVISLETEFKKRFKQLAKSTIHLQTTSWN